MRFLAKEPWLDHHSVYHPATPDSPHVFDYPKDMVPNWKWVPLDAEAKAALDALAQSSGLRVNGIPEIEAGFVPEVILPPEEPKPVVVAPVKPKPKDPDTMSGVQKGRRPSDVDP